MDRFDPFVKYADVYGDIINWEKDPMNKPQNQNKYFFSDGKTYYEQICKMLRLMSVFKEAFNQIYNNEDEISEAWENFVNNLSASVVEGNEPDVTLTWTDDSVNFEFTMVPGVPGDPGVGIASISFNSDYTMTITLSDGTTYTSMSLKGDTGPQGPQGETGSGLQILDVYATLADLQSAHPTGQPGDAYQVGSGGSYTLYIWSSSQSAWVQAGTLGTVSPYTSAPLMDGTASAGSQNLYARGDHVHPSDTSRASQEELDALIKTSQALIDQSFTYRESPAIQDGLARFDKIKGNTLVWNQLVKNGNFASTSNFLAIGATDFTVSGNIASFSVLKNDDQLQQNMPLTKGHKYLICMDVLNSSPNTIRIYWGQQIIVIQSSSSWQRIQAIADTSSLTTASYALGLRLMGSITSGTRATIQTKNWNCFDLTQMFGSGNEPTTVAEFTSLFPLPYYQYDVGSLLSFNGTGIKTVGFNKWDEEWEVGNINASTGQNEAINTCIRSKNYMPLLPNTTYYFYGATGNAGNVKSRFYDASFNYLGSSPVFGPNNSFTPPSDARYYRFALQTAYGVAYKNDICINISSSENGKYEPYTTSTATIPTDTYFPTGMKSAGSVYDEKTESKAITRVGQVVLDGTQTVIASNFDSNTCRMFISIPNIQGKTSSQDEVDTDVISSYLLPISNNLSNYGTAGIHRRVSGQQQLCVSLGVSAYTSGITTEALFNQYLSEHPLTVYYPLATPTEVNIDPPLELNYQVWEGGTEQLLPVNGTVPSTSPIIANMTYMSIDDAMEYIIEKLANVPLNTQQILDALEDDVADLQEDVGALQPAVSALQTSVGNINTNIGQLSSTVAGHTSSISDIQSDITDLNTGLSDLEDTVTDNTSRIGTLETGLSSTNGQVQNIATSVSGLDSTVTAQGTTITALDSIISDISNNPVNLSLGNHELGFVQASVEATLPANTGTMVTIPKPTIFPNNYTPLFIIGMTTGSYNVSICSIPTTFGNGDSVTCRVWNHGSQQTTQITVYILCMRQRQSQ